jgi:anti-anti-sigma regulatory factor
LRFDNSEGILTIFLEGDIDAQNAADIQQEIAGILRIRASSFYFALYYGII